MQEQINEKTVALSVRGVKLTGRMLAKAMRAFLNKSRQPHYKRGEQSMTSLKKQGTSLSNIEVSGDNIGSFRKIARKYSVDFSLTRDDSKTPPNWIVFFKAKDDKAMEAAFNEYSKSLLQQKTRKPSILAKLAKFMEVAKQHAAPVKNRNRGGHEL